MAGFVVYDHTNCPIYYIISSDLLVRGSGHSPSPDVVPVYFDGINLYVLFQGRAKVLGSYTIGREGQIGHTPTITISRNGFYGAAEVERREISFTRESIEGWEIFHCLKEYKCCSLEILKQSAWVSAKGKRRHERSEIEFYDNGFTISGVYYDILDNRNALEILSYKDREITLVRGMSAERFIRYSPLIYFVAFGPEEQRDCVAASIKSLIEVGGYRGDFYVITDRDDMNAVLPEGYDGSLYILKKEANSRIEMWKERYSIGDIGITDRYQPVLYMDTDVVCNDPVGPLLLDILLSSGVCVGTENHPGVVIIPSFYRESDAVGKALFEREGWYPDEPYGFNSGIIGFSHIDVARAAFDAVRSIIDRMIVLGNAQGWADQAVLNYVLHKIGCVDQKTISSMIAVGTEGDVYNYRETSTCPVLIHFWSTHAHNRVSRITGYVQNRIDELCDA